MSLYFALLDFALLCFALLCFAFKVNNQISILTIKRNGFWNLFTTHAPFTFSQTRFQLIPLPMQFNSFGRIWDKQGQTKPSQAKTSPSDQTHKQATTAAHNTTGFLLLSAFLLFTNFHQNQASEQMSEKKAANHAKLKVKLKPKFSFFFCFAFCSLVHMQDSMQYSIQFNSIQFTHSKSFFFFFFFFFSFFGLDNKLVMMNSTQISLHYLQLASVFLKN